MGNEGSSRFAQQKGFFRWTVVMVANSMNVPTNATDLHAEEWLRQKEREVERTRTEKDTPCKRHSKGS